MKVEFCRDTRKRKCQICGNNIAKKMLMIRDTRNSGYYNSMYSNFYHLSCMIRQLNKIQSNLMKKLDAVPKDTEDIEVGNTGE